MRIYGENWLKASVVQKLMTGAWDDTFDGIMTVRSALYMDSCTAFHAASGSVLIFTRDIGHHTSGWFKNPEFERCFHLSLHFTEPFERLKTVQFNQKLAQEWADLCFGQHAGKAWIESAKTDEGRALEVLHYRVFCDECWRPFMPHGEVYSTELTEKGWKSWSDLHGDVPEPSILHAG